jgi:hypothetical protein
MTPKKLEGGSATGKSKVATEKGADINVGSVVKKGLGRRRSKEVEMKEGRTEEKKKKGRKSYQKGNRAPGHQNQKRPKNEGKDAHMPVCRRGRARVAGVERMGQRLCGNCSGTRVRALE